MSSWRLPLDLGDVADGLRPRRLQQTVFNLQRDGQDDEEFSNLSIAQSPRSLQIERPRSAEESTSSVAAVAEARRSHPDEEVAMVLEDFAMGHRMNRDRATQRLAGVGAGGATPQTTATSPEGILTELRGISENNPLAFLVPHGFDYILRVLSALPDPQRCWALVQFYFAKHEWYTKVR